MKNTLILLMLALTVPAAQAAVLTTQPLEVSGENRCLECTVANVSNNDVTVSIQSAASDGTTTDLTTTVLAPQTATFALAHCGETDNFVCRFDVSGGRRKVRAAACEFGVALGCLSAAAAR